MGCLLVTDTGAILTLAAASLLTVFCISPFSYCCCRHLPLHRTLKKRRLLR